LFGFRQVTPPESDRDRASPAAGIVQLFGTAAGYPWIQQRGSDLPGWQPSCVNNCSEEEALLPGRIGVLPGCQTCLLEQLFGNLHLQLQAFLLRMNNCSGKFPGGCTKKKSRKTKTCSFYFLQLNKGYLNA